MHPLTESNSPGMDSACQLTFQMYFGEACPKFGLRQLASNFQHVLTTSSDAGSSVLSDRTAKQEV